MFGTLEAGAGRVGGQRPTPKSLADCEDRVKNLVRPAQAASNPYTMRWSLRRHPNAWGLPERTKHALCPPGRNTLRYPTF